MRYAVLALGLAVLLFSGCARHHVIERDVGRIDGAKSISSSSDTQWMIQQEPAASAEDAQAPSGENSTAHRLRELERLRERELISEDEYQGKRREILDSF
jgi:hypothetical protein